MSVGAGGRQNTQTVATFSPNPFHLPTYTLLLLSKPQSLNPAPQPRASYPIFLTSMTQSLMLIALLLCISPRSASAFSPAAFHRPASRLSAGASQPEPFFVDLPRLLAITAGGGLPEPADPLAAELRCRKEQRELRERLPAVYVILFGGGDDEGVHSVEVPPGSKQNVRSAESEASAKRREREARARARARRSEREASAKRARRE